MAEKGGKGFPMRKGKVASKTVATKQGGMKGKEGDSSRERHIKIDSSDSDSEGFLEENSQASKGSGRLSSEASRSGKKVSFDSLKTGGKPSFDTPSATGDWSTGGKASKPGKAGGKGGLPQATPLKVPIVEVDLQLEVAFPKDSRILMDCEAAEILQRIQEHLKVLSEDAEIKMPESFNKALEYSRTGSHYMNPQSVRQALEFSILKIHGVTDGEICMIGNVLPESVDEVYALVPSLKSNRFENEEPIRDVLASLANLRISK